MHLPECVLLFSDNHYYFVQLNCCIFQLSSLFSYSLFCSIEFFHFSAVFLIYPYVQRSDCLLESYKQVTMNGVSFCVRQVIMNGANFCVRQVIMNGANFCVPLKLLHFEPISATEPFQEFHVYTLKIIGYNQGSCYPAANI
ncbi:hypothetical protein CISIN_1g032456mg [Citrus sinensis]|uniref:Uncharacterized protein n=1 Tax=Citrus sinensis TaxID=2711 RepID=A0A067E2M3_CITSI|nr:hypothetical protein CISIN_1g032456mg [Citrus sinensis]